MRQGPQDPVASPVTSHVDNAVVVGAGLAGMYNLYRPRELRFVGTSDRDR
jgi:hypothetical protein